MRISIQKLAFFTLIFSLIVLPVGAQDEIVLTIGVPEWMVETFRNSDVFADFEAAHAGVRVQIVNTGNSSFYIPPWFSAEEHLNGVANYVTQADIVRVDSYNFSVEGTRAGYFLNLAPLVNTDAALDIDDFYPTVWQSYQWDGGIWAFPISASVNILIYDPVAFDAAGLPYPTSDWTFEDLALATRALTLRDAEGNVKPGFYTWDTRILLRSLLPFGLFDDTTLPAQPRLDDPQIVNAVQQYLDLQAELGINQYDVNASFDPNTVPITINQIYPIIYPQGDGRELKGALLPGGRAGLLVDGFAISAGTRHPELAYELLRYLSKSPEMASMIFQDRPARRSLVSVTRDRFGANISDEVNALIDTAIENAFPVSDMRFIGYLEANIFTGEPVIDLSQALQVAQENASASLELADARRNSGTPIVVVEPEVPPVLAEGEVAIRFRIISNISPLPNRELWETAAEEFVANDPQVGYIALDSGFRPLSEVVNEYDCFYAYNNEVQSLDNGLLLSLDPYINADVNLDTNDFVANVFSQVQRDGQTLAMPIAIAPTVLWYDSALFAQNGIPDPESGWTVDQFADALLRLSQSLPQDVKPFGGNTFSNSYLLMLIAAYGGMPVDISTRPITIDFTSAENVEAIRQVLDLAKAGLLDYRQLVQFGGSGMGGNIQQSPIYSDTLNTFGFGISRPFTLDENGNPVESSFRPTFYPRGSRYTPLSYTLSIAGISANSTVADACYRWISVIGRNPSLYGGIPVRRSDFSHPSIEQTFSVDVTAFLTQLDQILADPNATIIFDMNSGTTPSSIGDYLVFLWLNLAFDRYVLEDADLEAELSAAQASAIAYQECIAPMPPFDIAQYPTESDQQRYFEQFADCLILVDPDLADSLGILQD